MLAGEGGWFVGWEFRTQPRIDHSNDGRECNGWKPRRANRIDGGLGCGFNRIHAILGASPFCIATHPSDMCAALSALEARVRVQGPDGREREIPFIEFHRHPGETPHVDTSLMPDELIISVDLPRSPTRRIPAI
jgi:CO/xanthine dehydrogenase FAD-binding subunit